MEILQKKGQHSIVSQTNKAVTLISLAVVSVYTHRDTRAWWHR